MFVFLSLFLETIALIVLRLLCLDLVSRIRGNHLLVVEPKI